MFTFLAANEPCIQKESCGSLPGGVGAGVQARARRPPARTDRRKSLISTRRFCVSSGPELVAARTTRT
jgi:hypothetical protein